MPGRASGHLALCTGMPRRIHSFGAPSKAGLKTPNVRRTRVDNLLRPRDVDRLDLRAKKEEERRSGTDHCR